MYCIYCGSKVEDSYNVCPSCGALLKSIEGNVISNNDVINNFNNQNNVKVTKNSNWKDTISIVSGVFGLFFVYTVFVSYEEIILEYGNDFNSAPYAYAFGSVLWQLGFATAALLLALSSRKTNQNSINKVGIIIAILIYIFAIIQFIMVGTYKI